MKTIVLAVLMSTVLLAHGQVRKCIGPDGKVTYSDFVCVKNTASESSVTTRQNTIDSSGYRQEAEMMKNNAANAALQARNENAVNAALQTDGAKCKFSYFSLGDAHGKTLASAARTECLNNIKAKALGQPTSLEAYGFWKDHSTQQSSNRQAEMSRAEAATNARNLESAIDKQNRTLKNQTYTCKRGTYSSDLECKSQ